jgi:mono/diheme cytochrome c family protein
MVRGLLAVISLVLALGAGAGAVDLHHFWDQRCAECHGHAGAFARRFLKVEDGRLVGVHHRHDLATFMGQHEMGPELVAPMQAMLLAQVATPPVFQQKCARCHGTAAEFARTSLTLPEGVLTGRESGRPVAEYLLRHGRLTEAERPIVVESLNRVLREVGGPRSP